MEAVASDTTRVFHEAHKKAAQALAGWHLSEGKDPTLFEGVSLARLHHIHLVEPVTFLFHQAARGLDPASPAFLQDSKNEKARPAVGPLPLRRTDWKAAAFRRFYRLIRLLPAAPARSILILGSHSNRILWEYWLGHLPENPGIRLDFMLNYPPGLSNGLRSVLHGARMLEPQARSLAQAQRQEIVKIRSALTKLPLDPRWRSLFRLGDTDFSHLFARTYFLPFVSQLETLAEKYLSWEAEFARNQPDIILLPQEVSSEARILLALAKRRGNLVFFLNHGFPAYYRSDENLQCGDYEPDLILAWGDEDKKNYLRAGVPEKKIRVTGPPAFDAFLPLAIAKPFQGVLGSTPMLLGYSSPFVGYQEDNEETYFLEALRLLDRLGAKRVLFKLHPGRPRVEFYRGLLSQAALNCTVEFLQWESFPSALGRADWVVGGFSTAIFETLLSGKDYFLLNYDPGGLFPHAAYSPFEPQRPYAAATIEALKKNLLEGRPVPRADILRDFCAVQGGEQAWHFSRKVFAEIKSALR